ncbi:multifunctional CCA protein [Campylobacterota bacterium]|nr:multifunctional CCA protein [Campylobacterota bacterium]
MKLPPHFQADFSRIYDALKPFTNRAYFVGGAVRDCLLEHDFNDVDIEIYDISPETFEKLMEGIGAIGVGKSFFVYKLGAFDLSLPRVERKISRGHTGFEVRTENDPRLAAKRRDFTINAIMVNIFDGEILDFWGGRSDLKARLIRHIDDEAFAEDSLRVLRSVRFAAQLGFKIAPKTAAICREIAIDDLSKERIWLEFEKIAAAKDRLKGLWYIIALSISRRLFGEERSSLRLFRLVRRSPLFYAMGVFWHKKRAVLEQINAPKNLRREIESDPSPPKKVSDRFLAAIALKKPLKEWAGAKFLNIEKRAKELGFYDEKFDPQVKSADLMREGFSGKELGEQMRKRILDKVRKYGK